MVARREAHTVLCCRVARAFRAAASAFQFLHNAAAGAFRFVFLYNAAASAFRFLHHAAAGAFRFLYNAAASGSGHLGPSDSYECYTMRMQGIDS